MIATDTPTDAARLETAAGVRLRAELAVLDVSGEDQRTWLNGQISNDVRETRRGDAVYALVLNVRGKILCDLWAVDRGDGFSLIIPRDVTESLIAHLEQYIIMEDVVLTVRPDTSVISVQGPRSAEVMHGLVAENFPCDELGLSGAHVLVAASQAQSMLAELNHRAAAVGGGTVSEESAERVRVRRGIPRFGVDFNDTNYPQEAGLKQRAVSFSKGCYLGQEVVCTLESRGKLSRKLVALKVDHGAAHVGDTIATDTGEESGKITSVTSDDNAGHALGYVRRIHIDQRVPLRCGPSIAVSIDRIVGEA